MCIKSFSKTEPSTILHSPYANRRSVEIIGISTLMPFILSDC